MQWTSDVITVTSHRRHSVTSSPKRTSDVIRTGVSGGISSSIHDNVVKTTSVLLTVSLTASGDHVTTPPDETPHSGRSANYVGERVTVVIVICLFVLVLILVITIVTVVLVRYVYADSFCHHCSIIIMDVKRFHVTFSSFNTFISPTFSTRKRYINSTQVLVNFNENSSNQ